MQTTEQRWLLLWFDAIDSHFVYLGLILHLWPQEEHLARIVPNCSMAEWDCSARGKRLCCYFPPWVATTLIIHECSLWSHVTCTEITLMCLWFTFSAIHTFRFIRPIIRNPAIKTLATNIYYHVNFCNVQSEMKSLQRHLGQMSLCCLPATIGVVTL